MGWVSVSQSGEGQNMLTGGRSWKLPFVRKSAAMNGCVAHCTPPAAHRQPLQAAAHHKAQGSKWTSPHWYTLMCSGPCSSNK